MWFCWDPSNTSDFEHGNSPRNYHNFLLLPSKLKTVKEDKDKIVHCNFRTRKKVLSFHAFTPARAKKWSNSETVGSLHSSDLWGCPDHPQNASNFHLHQSFQRILRPLHGQCFKISSSEILCSPEQDGLFQKYFKWFPNQKKHTSFDGHNYTFCYLINSHKLLYTMWTC